MPKKTFENSMTELELTVKQLENGDTTLEDALLLFEKGIKLTKECQSMLDKAESKVSVLLKNDTGEIKKQEFLSEEE